jgi:hypothetical protein
MLTKVQISAGGQKRYQKRKYNKKGVFKNFALSIIKWVLCPFSLFIVPKFLEKGLLACPPFKYISTKLTVSN